MQNLDEAFSYVPLWQKIIIYSMIVIAFLTLWLSLYTPILDGDIWFHILYGKAILENHHLVPDHTLYSWTPSSNEHIYCAWIGHILYYLLYTFFGQAGVIVWRYIAATTLFIAILFLSRQRCTFYNPLTWFTASVCSLIICQICLDKPETITFILMVFIVWNWYVVKQLRQDVLYFIYLFPLLILVWVNAHGGFIYGCLFLLCVGFGESINQLFYRQNALPRKVYFHLIVSLFLSAGCTLITPYGYHYIYQLVMENFDNQRHINFKYIMAYRDTFSVNNLPQVHVFADIAILTILLVFGFAVSKKQLDFVPVISNLLFAFLFTVYGRLILPWISVFSLAIVYYGSSFTITRRRVVFFASLAISSFFLSGWLLNHERQFPSKGQWLKFGFSEQYTIEEEIDFINENYKSAKVGNTYNYGAYILWKMWPENKVMIDARYFPYASWIKEFLDFTNCINVKQFLDKYPFDVIPVDHSHYTLITWFNKSKDWKPVFYGKNAVVFVRSSFARSSQVTRGKNLRTILESSTASGAFNTAVMLKDWEGADIIISTMKHNFTIESQLEVISGFENVKLAAEMYERKDYSASIDYMEKAFQKKVYDKYLYTSALLMKAIEDWQDKKWTEAIRFTIKALQMKDSFAATYNLALMAWQLDNSKSEAIQKLSLTAQEREIVSKWKIALATLVQNKEKYPESYLVFLENAHNILENKGGEMQLILPEY